MIRTLMGFHVPLFKVAGIVIRSGDPRQGDFSLTPAMLAVMIVPIDLLEIAIAFGFGYIAL